MLPNYQFIADSDVNKWIEKKFYKDTNIFVSDEDYKHTSFNAPIITQLQNKIPYNSGYIDNDSEDDNSDINQLSYSSKKLNNDSIYNDLSLDFIKRKRGRPKKNFNPFLDFNFTLEQTIRQPEFSHPKSLQTKYNKNIIQENGNNQIHKESSPNTQITTPNLTDIGNSIVSNFLKNHISPLVKSAELNDSNNLSSDEFQYPHNHSNTENITSGAFSFSTKSIETKLLNVTSTNSYSKSHLISDSIDKVVNNNFESHKSIGDFSQGNRQTNIIKRLPGIRGRPKGKRGRIAALYPNRNVTQSFLTAYKNLTFEVTNEEQQLNSDLPNTLSTLTKGVSDHAINLKIEDHVLDNFPKNYVKFFDNNNNTVTRNYRKPNFIFAKDDSENSNNEMDEEYCGTQGQGTNEKYPIVALKKLNIPYLLKNNGTVNLFNHSMNLFAHEDEHM
ncbi:unnamed protein product [Gordionus sp. m RMFG-2023]|uniref:GATA zinc finger domain-containing protein 14-like isoform X2 n=1 Tax=Gordionus sp. m RMFG-2023 TaxID=3053472 RepID=UPI0030DEB8C0